MMIPRYKSSLILYSACVLYALTLGYRIYTSNCRTNIRIQFMETIILQNNDDNFYRILDPKHLQCKAFIDGSKKAIDRYVKDGRVVVTKEPDLSMKCEDIRNRIRQFAHVDNQGDVPFAVARNVFSNYFMQEVFVGLHYSPKNNFCFALDSKSPKIFKDKVKKMAECLPNVMVIDKEFKFSSGGHFQDFAHFACIQKLLTLPKWTYVLLLQNNDLIIKTKSEIAQILGVMNGTQIFGSQNPWKLKNRYPHELMPNAKVGKMFKSEKSHSEAQLKQNISYAQGLNEVFLSREFIHALDTQLNMDHLLTIFNKKWYGVDEFLLPTLAINAHLGLPGQSSKVCWHPKDYGPVRYHIWSNKAKCKTNHKRHNICMMTVEYLPEMIYRHEIVANKIWPASDFGSVLCMIEILKERAVLNWPMVGLNRFENLPQVQEMRQKNLGTFDLKTFKCPWEKK